MARKADDKVGWDLAAPHRAVMVILNRPRFGENNVPPVPGRMALLPGQFRALRLGR